MVAAECCLSAASGTNLRLRLAVVVAAVCSLQGGEADIAPPRPLCKQVCSQGCSGGSKQCCIGGQTACSQGSCSSDKVQLPGWSCQEDDHSMQLGPASSPLEGMLSSTRCCLPRCTSDGDCGAGELCRGDGVQGKYCARPTCVDLGGTCRAPELDANGMRPACLPSEVEQRFQDRCDSGCGYWRGLCGQTCCLPSGALADTVAAPTKSPVAFDSLHAPLIEEIPQLPGSGDLQEVQGDANGNDGPTLSFRFLEIASLAMVAGGAIWLCRRSDAAEQPRGRAGSTGWGAGGGARGPGRRQEADEEEEDRRGGSKEPWE